jgi:hypothetical protein
VDVRVGLGQQLLQLGVLALQLTQPLRIGHVHAPVLRAPFVERRVAETALAASFLRGIPASAWRMKSMICSW